MAGWSPEGAVGVDPANGLNTRLATVTRTFESPCVGCVALSVDCDGTVTLCVSGEFFKSDTGDHVEAVLAMCGATTLGVSVATVDCVLITTSLIASLALLVLAETEADESTPAEFDRSRFLLGCDVEDVDRPESGAARGVAVEADR